MNLSGILVVYDSGSFLQRLSEPSLFKLYNVFCLSLFVHFLIHCLFPVKLPSYLQWILKDDWHIVPDYTKCTHFYIRCVQNDVHNKKEKKGLSALTWWCLHCASWSWDPFFIEFMNSEETGKMRREKSGTTEMWGSKWEKYNRKMCRKRSLFVNSFYFRTTPAPVGGTEVLLRKAITFLLRQRHFIYIVSRSLYSKQISLGTGRGRKFSRYECREANHFRDRQVFQFLLGFINHNSGKKIMPDISAIGSFLLFIYEINLSRLPLCVHPAVQ